MIKIKDYFSEAQWQKFLSAAVEHETPFLLVDLSLIKQKFEEMVMYFPNAKIHYAMKANPGVPVINLLRDLGSNFDCASIFELDRVFDSGVTPDRVSYGNTIKKAAHIKYAYDKGVRLYATDSKADIQKIAENAPGSRVFVRILVEGGDTAEWPLSRKFGFMSVVNRKILPYGMTHYQKSNICLIG